jgi:hypothetical protein
MRNIGLAATQRVVRMSQGHRGSFDSALAKLQDLAQNFPLHAASLTADSVGRDVEAEAAARAQPTSQWHHLGVEPGQSALWINGATVGTSPASTVFDVHEVIRTIAKEHRLAKMFAALPLPAQERDQLRVLAARGFNAGGSSSGGGGGGSVRVDLRSGAKGALHFFNNLEKDARYKHWDRSLVAILQPSWQLPRIAANLYTAVAIIDPSTPMGVRAIGDALAVFNSGMPMRIGLCFTDGADDDDNDDGDNSDDDEEDEDGNNDAAKKKEETEEGEEGTKKKKKNKNKQVALPPLSTDSEAPATARHIARLVQAAKLKYSHLASSAFLEELANKAFGDATSDADLVAAMVDDDATFTIGRLCGIFAEAAKAAEKAWRSASYLQDCADVLRAGNSNSAGGGHGGDGDGDDQYYYYTNKHGEKVAQPDELLELGRRFAASKGLAPGRVTINGLVDAAAPLDGSVQNSMGLVLRDMRHLQKLVSMGKLRDGDNILAELLKGGTVPRFHPDVLGTNFNARPVPFPAYVVAADPSSSSSSSSSPLAALPFLYGSRAAAEADAAAVSFAVASDWDTPTGVRLALSALRHLQANGRGGSGGASSSSSSSSGGAGSLDFFSLHRVVLVDSGTQSSRPGTVQRRALAALQALAHSQAAPSAAAAAAAAAAEFLGAHGQQAAQQRELAAAVQVVELLAQHVNEARSGTTTTTTTTDDRSGSSSDIAAAVVVAAMEAAVAAVVPEGALAAASEEDSLQAVSSRHASVVRTLFGLEGGSNAVVSNGHLVLAQRQQQWDPQDFELLATLEGRHRTRRVGRFLQQQLLPHFG